MSDHLLHWQLSQDWVSCTITCEHDPEDEVWLAREDEGDGEIIAPHECWVHSWMEADGFQEYWLAGAWPSDPPSPCPIDCHWKGDCFEITFAAATKESET